MAKLRLDKYLCDMQLGTRSQVKEYIRKGRIMVDDNVITSPEAKVDTDTSTILFDKMPVFYCYQFYKY